MEESSSMLVSALLPRLPLFAVMVLGCVVAVVRWEKHPAVSALVVGACGLDVLLGVAGGLLPMLIRDYGMALGRILSFGLGLLGAATKVVLIAAVFIGRDAAPARPAP